MTPGRPRRSSHEHSELLGGHGVLALICSAVLLPAVATACAGHLPPCPAAGGPAWTELQGTHFRLRTDATPAAGRAVLTDLEQFRAALLTVFGAPPDFDTGKIPVVVVDNGWTDFAPRRVLGYFIQTMFQPLVVMMAGGELHRREVIKHELVHYFSRMVMRRQPPWLSEGLAVYYQTIEYDADAGRITVGRPPADWLRDARHASTSSITSALTARSTSAEGETLFYASAWITVHYLMNHRLVALAAYEKALHDGASPEAAWTTAFGAQTPGELAEEVRQYLDGGRYALLVYRFAAPALAGPVERRLTDADTHAMRALLHLTGSQIRGHASELSAAHGAPRPAAQREIDEALRQEPDHVASRAIAHWALGAPIDLQQATALSQKHGDDWLAWLLMAEALLAHHDSADDALDRATGLAAADRSITIPAPHGDH
jgi:hypothetical protein